MRKIALFTAVALITGQILGGAAVCTAGALEEQTAWNAPLAADNSRFAFDLYKKIAGTDKNENIFFSPYSISTALAMTYAGAAGNTEKQMAGVLHFTLPQDELHAAFAGLSGQLRSIKGCRLSIANALWGQEGYPFKDEFKTIVNQYYDGGFNTTDFAGQTEESRQTINNWVTENTGGKIRDLLQQGDIGELTRLVLTNAIYFKGDWANQFNKSQTREGDFFTAAGEKVGAPMMNRTAQYGYAESDDMQALAMPYAGDELSMIVLLPKKDMAAFEAGFTPDTLAECLSAMRNREVTVSIPKFKLEARYGLAKTLSAMGMPDAFDGRAADFSGLNGNKDLHITGVIHQAVIDVNEEGSEAAAATAVVVGVRSIMTGNCYFIADHPFIFLIRHNASGTILFMGKVNNPVQ